MAEKLCPDILFRYSCTAVIFPFWSMLGAQQPCSWPQSPSQRPFRRPCRTSPGWSLCSSICLHLKKSDSEWQWMVTEGFLDLNVSKVCLRKIFFNVERNHFLSSNTVSYTAQRPRVKVIEIFDLRSISTSCKRGLLILNQCESLTEQVSFSSSVSTGIYKINGFVNSHSFHQEKMAFRIAIKEAFDILLLQPNW